MKFLLTIFYVFVLCIANAQIDSAVNAKQYTARVVRNKPKNFVPQKVDSLHHNVLVSQPLAKVDSLKINDTALAKHIFDSTQNVKDSSKTFIKKDSSTYKLLIDYPILNNTKPELMITAFKDAASKDILFYALLLVVVVFAIVKPRLLPLINWIGPALA